MTVEDLWVGNIFKFRGQVYVTICNSMDDRHSLAIVTAVKREDTNKLVSISNFVVLRLLRKQKIEILPGKVHINREVIDLTPDEVELISKEVMP